eukprot:TRINITY_DN41142_c0_g1_i4.p1 TRINITY_DN41142_c0_g1~~TRINITY_DN41142_c0_g1_i4.p1  ORF type:complete len:155 (-),score=10.25 TRINITY_DN41142_c0_g1_i4:123-587(-)
MKTQSKPKLLQATKDQVAQWLLENKVDSNDRERLKAYDGNKLASLKQTELKSVLATDGSLLFPLLRKQLSEDRELLKKEADAARRAEDLKRLQSANENAVQEWLAKNAFDGWAQSRLLDYNGTKLIAEKQETLIELLGPREGRRLGDLLLQTST